MDLFGIGLVVFGNGDHDHLSRVEEKGVFTSRVFSDNRDETFHTSQNSSMDDHRACIPGLAFHIILIFIAFTVLQIKAFGIVEVQLDRSALMRTFKCVIELNVDFRSIEGTVTRIQLPRLAQGV